MKRPLNTLQQEELDLLLFDYMEGELTGQDSKVLEQSLLTDPLLAEELESWKETVVIQDFYNTEVLEEKILSAHQHPENFPFPISLNTWLLTFMTTILSIMPVSDERISSLGDRPVVRNTTVQTNIVAGLDRENGSAKFLVTKGKEAVGNKADVEKAKPQGAVKGEQKEGDAINPPPIVKNSERLSLPFIVETISIKPPVKNTIERIVVDHMVKVRIVNQQQSPQMISRKQQRMITRKKEKSLQQRQAREFMKGNVPYVVPLNSQNF